MSHHRSFSFALVLLLAFPVMVHAQHNRGAVHPGGQMPHPGGTHPGQQGRPGMMSPEEQMMHAWFQQQMMLSRMPRSSRANSGAAHANSNSSRSNSGPNHAPGKGANGSPKANTAKGAAAGSPGQSQQNQQQNRTKAKPDKADAAKNKEQAKHAEREKREANARAIAAKHANNNRSTHGVDSRAVGLLKTAHTKLREADADYQGHRMRSMEHIVSAIHRLESSSGVNGGGGIGGYGGMGGFGGSTLPQGQSDRLMRDALVHLRQTQGMLGTGSTAAEHHRDAHAAITEAIHEVEVALRVR
jgi:hypothetical protein